MATVTDLHGRHFLRLIDYSADEILYLLDLPAELKAAKKEGREERHLTGEFAEGSMGSKVRAACMFAERTGRRAVIGSTEDIQALLAGKAGTTVQPELARTA